MHLDLATVLCYLMLMIIAILDVCTRRIPNSLTILLIAFGTFGISMRAESIGLAVLSMLTVGLPLLLFASKTGSIMGGGDVKLCAAAAFCFGALPVLLMLILTLLAMLLWSRLFDKSSLPMAPFFAVCSLLLITT